MSATPSTSWAHDAWNRATAAQEAQLVSKRIGDELVTQSALRLNRSHERLNRCGQRVTRGQQRRV